MAEALEKIEEDVNCPICFDIYSDPKILQCSHSFCQKCLEKLGLQDSKLVCPVCRKVTPIPRRGVASLKPAFHINCLLEIRELLQKQDPPGTARKVRRCSVHENRELQLYCDTCKKFICLACGMTENNHHHHHFVALGEISPSPVKKEVRTIKRVPAKVDTHFPHQQAVAEDARQRLACYLDQKDLNQIESTLERLNCDVQSWRDNAQSCRRRTSWLV